MSYKISQVTAYIYPDGKILSSKKRISAKVADDGRFYFKMGSTLRSIEPFQFDHWSELKKVRYPRKKGAFPEACMKSTNFVKTGDEAKKVRELLEALKEKTSDDKEVIVNENNDENNGKA